MELSYDVVVVGGGHAGVEAAAARGWGAEPSCSRRISPA